MSADASLEGILTGKGTRKLGVRGVAVQVNARDVWGTHIQLNYGASNGDELINLRLLPGKHYLNSHGSNVIEFRVAANGTVDYDASLNSIFAGRGTKTLTVRGWTTTINATAKNVGYVNLDFTGPKCRRLQCHPAAGRAPSPTRKRPGLLVHNQGGRHDRLRRHAGHDLRRPRHAEVVAQVNVNRTTMWAGWRWPKRRA